MRKTLIAIAIGVTALAVAACGNSGSGSSSGTSGGGASSAPLESTAPLDSGSGTLESPSDMLSASPSSS
jgi:ABC-type glycerol-3-phosphate transport system substrate-binding protein